MLPAYFIREGGGGGSSLLEARWCALSSGTIAVEKPRAKTAPFQINEIVAASQSRTVKDKTRPGKWKIWQKVRSLAA